MNWIFIPNSRPTSSSCSPAWCSWTCWPWLSWPSATPTSTTPTAAPTTWAARSATTTSNRAPRTRTSRSQGEDPRSVRRLRHVTRRDRGCERGEFVWCRNQVPISVEEWNIYFVRSQHERIPFVSFLYSFGDYCVFLLNNLHLFDEYSMTGW